MIRLASTSGSLRSAHKRSGLSMVELMIAMTTMAVVLGAVALAALQGNNAFQTGHTVSTLEAQGQRALDRIVEELREAGRTGLVPDPQPPFGSATLDYQNNLGWGGAAIVWDTPTRMAFELMAGELDDGIDNNGNGLIDEGSVVWRRDPGQPGEQRVVFCNYVREYLAGELPNGLDDNGNGLIDELGLSFSANGDTITVRLTLERLDEEGHLITRTVETAVTLRN